MIKQTTKTTLRGLFNLVSAILCPAHIFWRAYLDYAPESLWWWCQVVFGLFIAIGFAIILNDLIQHGANTSANVKKEIGV